MIQGRGPRRAMGLDVGERRVGVAIGDELDLISSPLTIVQRRDGDLAELRDLAIDKGVDRLVVGLPTGLSGREGHRRLSCASSRRRLDAVGPEIRVVFWDERLSTTVAERTLQESGTWRRRRGDVDAVAAAVILQGYLDAGRAQGCEEMNRIMAMRGSMCVPTRSSPARQRCHSGAIGRQKMLDETDSATNVGCRQFRKARSE